MTAFIQRSLKLGVRLVVPVLDLRAARGALGLGENEIVEMVEDGTLPWAWDIAARGARRRELRVLAADVRDLQSGGEPIERSTGEILELIHGSPRPFIWGTEWRLAWNCDSQHMIRMVRDGWLAVVSTAIEPDGRAWRRGPGGSPCLAWESVAGFVEQRRIV